MTEAEAFKKLISGNAIVKEVLSRIRDGTATHRDQVRLSEEMGRLTAALCKNLVKTPDEIPGILKIDYDTLSKMCAEAQTCINQAAGLGLKGVRPKPGDRLTGLQKFILDNLDEPEKIVEPIETMNRQVVDSTAKYNARYQHDTGIRGKIVRTLHPEEDTCKWCASLAGEYDIDRVPDDIYLRHEGCNCDVEYRPAGGGRQNVWSKKWS